MVREKNSFPFTVTQWQELEHQALIFKYLVSGIPIPPDLLFTLKRSYVVDSAIPSKLFSSNVCCQMGLGKKIDPEPERCRRTDGKKWRCSKEAFPDSKYCERHMHRGKHRSRNPVELVFKSTTYNTTTTKTNPSNQSSNNSNNYSSCHHDHQPCYNDFNFNHHSFPNYHQNSSSRPLGLGLSLQDNYFNSGFYSLKTTNTDHYRNQGVNYGVKEEVDEDTFFSDKPNSESKTMRCFSVSSSMNDSKWQLTPLCISCSSSSSTNQTSMSIEEKQDHQEHFYERNEETQKTIHHFI